MDHADFINESKKWTPKDWDVYNNAYNNGMNNGLMVLMIIFFIALLWSCFHESNVQTSSQALREQREYTINRFAEATGAFPITIPMVYESDPGWGWSLLLTSNDSVSKKIDNVYLVEIDSTSEFDFEKDIYILDSVLICKEEGLVLYKALVRGMKSGVVREVLISGYTFHCIKKINNGRFDDKISNIKIPIIKEEDEENEALLDETHSDPPVVPSDWIADTILPGFSTTYYDTTTNYCEKVHYTVDFPQQSVSNSDVITRWLVDRILDSESNNSATWQYDGDKNEEESTLFSTLILRANVLNKRYVTYKQYTYSYFGGAHGYHTECLLSYDFFHGQEINYEYLFKNGCKEDLLDILIEVAKSSPKYKEWNPDIRSGVSVKDEEGKPTGEICFPQPGLSNDGVVFSFQPYEISGFVAGTFHFCIPYEQLRPYLTDKAKMCLNMQ